MRITAYRASPKNDQINATRKPDDQDFAITYHKNDDTKETEKKLRCRERERER